MTDRADRRAQNGNAERVRAAGFQTPLREWVASSPPGMVKFLAMKRRALRIAVLLWLGWYLSGPLCETFDFWDPPRAEIHDIERNAGGAVTLVAAIICFAIFVMRKWRERFSSLARTLQDRFLPLNLYLPVFATPAAHTSSHSPPLLPLRI